MKFIHWSRWAIGSKSNIYIKLVQFADRAQTPFEITRSLRRLFKNKWAVLEAKASEKWAIFSTLNPIAAVDGAFVLFSFRTSAPRYL
jgi:hypothetical protein